MTTRPTPSRVREALFSIIAAQLLEARVLDLFAGTGALGIEALSRGAAHAVFVEQDQKVLPLLRRNVAFFGPQSRIVAASARQAMSTLATTEAPFNLVFVDPPYAAGLYQPTLQALTQHAMLAPDAVVVCEHHSKTPAPKTSEALVLRQTRAFGDVAITFFDVACNACAKPPATHKGLAP